ncbi:hypothetical protein Vlu01_13710 [Micromonospora lutea]|uniref:Uncharacterized protein n=1 Tax=Micromonospora lutea TaxID=419825 RepID=A0ABQ4IS75_9ACTN|nr:hypothetical protein Vlu01_13710 [Micromonospora lutea]
MLAPRIAALASRLITASTPVSRSSCSSKLSRLIAPLPFNRSPRHGGTRNRDGSQPTLDRNLPAVGPCDPPQPTVFTVGPQRHSEPTRPDRRNSSDRHTCHRVTQRFSPLGWDDRDAGHAYMGVYQDERHGNWEG